MVAPIVGVVVHPAGAQVTRRGRVRLPGPAGGEVEFRVTVDDLPLELDPESVRVTGNGPVRLLGVEVAHQTRAEAVGEAVEVLRGRSRTLRRRLAELADADDTERARRAFLDVAARNAASALARAWAGGPAGIEADTRDPGTGEPPGPAPLAAAGRALAAEIDGVHHRRRALAEEREEVERELAATEREAARRPDRDAPDARRVVVTLDAPAGTGPEADREAGSEADPEVGLEVELELSYRVRTAGWTSVYDARVEGERVTLTWYGMVSQSTGEDWPAEQLTLSTARTAVARQLPELEPWYVDVRQPRMQQYMAAAAGAPEGAGPPVPFPMSAPASAGAPMPRGGRRAAARDVEAVHDVTGPVATYRPARPVAIPADGSPHRTTVAVVELVAALDHLTAPKVADEVHLRATVTNTSDHTLLPGKVSVFHGSGFVGTAALDLLAPGAETELHLGVDDRVRIERDLVRRTTGKRIVGNARSVEVAYRLRVTNLAARPIRVTVRDQLPVSRHESVVVRDVQLKPEPQERTDLGVLAWTLELAVGARQDIGFSFRLEHPRGVDLAGWTT